MADIDVPQLTQKMISDSSASTPDRYVEEMQSHVNNLLEGVKESHNVETELEQLGADIEEIDRSVIEELEDVMNKFATYGHDMETFIRFVANEVQEYAERGQSVPVMEVINDFRDALEGGSSISMKHSTSEVMQVLREIHSEMKDVFEKLRKKDEKLNEIEKKAEKVKNWDTNIENEIGQIETMVEDAEKLTRAFEPLDQKVDPSAWG